ncbi:MAG: hypothetical protein FJ039_12040 [Chloroflexi bacterium]|nr:hypothetical protein [Chloroflexota bacterium]
MRASHAAFTLKLLGYDQLSVYDGSMSEWANLDETPLEKDGKVTTGLKPAPAKRAKAVAPKPARKSKTKPKRPLRKSGPKGKRPTAKKAQRRKAK